MRSKRGPALSDREVESLLRADSSTAGSAAPGLAAALSVLRRAGSGPVAAPTAALTALLSEGFTPQPVVSASPRRRKLRVTLVAAGATSGLLLAATGANALPAPGQRAVAGFLNVLTPFHFPTPATERPAVPKQGPPPALVRAPEPTEDVTDEPSQAATPDPDRQHDGVGGTDEGPDGEPTAGGATQSSDSGDRSTSHDGGSEATPAPAEDSSSAVPDSGGSDGAGTSSEAP